MLALMLALHERVERSEAIQDQQDQALQVPVASKRTCPCPLSHTVVVQLLPKVD